MARPTECKIGVNIGHAPEKYVMFLKELRQAGHVRRFFIGDAGDQGWEVRVEQDSRVVRRVCYTDWHRVERALAILTLQVSELEARGWREPAAPW